MAVAYSTSRVFDAPDRQPGEGTRVFPSAAERAILARDELAAAAAAVAHEPVIGGGDAEFVIGAAPAGPRPANARTQPPLIDDFDDDGPMIGGGDGSPAEFVAQQPPPLTRGASIPASAVGDLPPEPERYVPQRKRAPAPYVAREAEPLRRRAPAAPERPSPGSPMPRVYAGGGLLQYWYVPAAAVVAVFVAAGVIFAAELVFGGDGVRGPAVATGLAPVVTSPVTATASVGAAGRPTAAAGTAATSAKFTPGEIVVVTGVGGSTGDCLNVRTAPEVADGNSIGCVPDGTELTVSSGPQVSGALRWWKVKPPASLSQGEGWVAEEYIERKP